jgi:tetratricopeptide (TPR) repeat protein
MPDPAGSSNLFADLDWNSALDEWDRRAQGAPKDVNQVSDEAVSRALVEALEALSRDGSQGVASLVAASEIHRAMGDASRGAAILAGAPADWLVAWQRARCLPDASDAERLVLLRDQASRAPSSAVALDLHLKAFELARALGQACAPDVVDALATDGGPISQELGLALRLAAEPIATHEHAGLPAVVAAFARATQLATAHDWLGVVNALDSLSSHLGAGASVLANAIARAARLGSRPVAPSEFSSRWDRLLQAIDRQDTGALAECAEVFRATDRDLSDAIALLSGKQVDGFDEPLRAANYAVWKAGLPSSSQAVAAEFIDGGPRATRTPAPLEVERALRGTDPREACRALSEWIRSLIGEDVSLGIVEATQLARLGQKDGARAVLERLTETAPDHPAVLEALRRVASRGEYVGFLQGAAEATSKTTASHFQLEAAGFSGADEWIALLQGAHVALPFAAAIERFVSGGGEGWPQRWAAATGQKSECSWADALAKLEGTNVAQACGLPATRGAAAREHERLADTVESAERDKLLVAAASGYLDDGLTDEALRALGAVADKTSPCWRILYETAEAQLSVAATATDQLLDALKVSASPDERVGMHERLAWLDELVRGDSASALFNHQAIIEEDPHNRASLRRIARSAADLPVWFDAIADLAGLIDPRCPEAGAHAELAAHRWSSRDAGTLSAELLERLGAAPALRVATTRALALGAVDQHRLTDAERWVTGLLSRVPDARGPYAEMLAMLAFLHDDSERCVRWAQEALDAQPERVLARLLLPLGLEAAGDFVNALDHTAALIDALPPGSPPALKRSLLKRAVRLADLSKRDVLRWLAPLCAADPSDADIFRRGAQLAREGQNIPALCEILRARLAAATGSDRTAIEVELADLVLSSGDAKGAVALIESALRARPDEPEALRVSVRAFRAVHENAREEAALLQLVRRPADESEHVAYLLRLATLYTHHLVNFARAEAAAKEVLRRSPDHDAALELLVTIYRQQNDGASALQTQERRIAIAGASADVRARTLELAELYETVCSQPAKAERLLERLRDGSPLHVGLIDRLALLLARTGQVQAREFALDRSVIEAHRALERGADPVDCCLAIDRCYELGQRDRSITQGLLEAFAGRSVHAQPELGRLRDLERYRPEELTHAVVAYFGRMGKALDEVAAGSPTGAAFVGLDAHSPLAAQAAVALNLRVRALSTSSRKRVEACGNAVAVHPRMAELSAGARAFLMTAALCHNALGTAFMTRIDGPEAATLIEASILSVAPTAFFEDQPERALIARRLSADGFAFDTADSDLPLLALEVLGSFRHDWARLARLFDTWTCTAAWAAIGYDSAAVIEGWAWRTGLSREEVVTTPDYRAWLLHALQPHR